MQPNRHKMFCVVFSLFSFTINTATCSSVSTIWGDHEFISSTPGYENFSTLAPDHQMMTTVYPPVWTTNCPFGCDCREFRGVLISGSLMEEIPTLPRNTKHLTYRYAEKNELNKYIFRKIFVSELEELDLHMNSVSHVGTGIFDGMSMLKRLSLYWNKIGKFSENLFSDTSMIESLDIAHNRFNFIPFKALCKLHHLQSFSMGHNPLLDITWNDPCTRKLTELRNISFADTQLKYLLHNDSFSGFKWLKLEGLDISEGNINTLPKLLFASANHLKFLDLSSNRIQSLSETHFLAVRNLEVLNIHTCDMEIFENFTRFRSLRIRCNRGSFMTSQNIQELTKQTHLQRLYISGSRNVNISMDSFIGFNTSVHIQEITLEGISIDQVEKGAFKWFRTISKISFLLSNLNALHIRNVMTSLSGSTIHIALTGNQGLRVLMDETFANMQDPGNIKTMNLGNCGLIGEIPVSALMPLVNMELLDLSHNYLDGILTMHDGQFLKLSTLLLNANSIKVATVALFKSFPNLKTIDLSSNNIVSWISSDVLSFTHILT